MPRRPFGAVYLNNDTTYSIQTMFESLNLRNVDLSKQMRYGTYDALNQKDHPIFTHLRIGLCEANEGQTLYVNDEINGDVSSEFQAAGLTWSSALLTKEKVMQPGGIPPTSIFQQAFQKEQWSDYVPAVISKHVSLTYQADRWYGQRVDVKYTTDDKKQHVTSFRGGMIVNTIQELFNSFRWAVENDDDPRDYAHMIYSQKYQILTGRVSHTALQACVLLAWNSGMITLTTGKPSINLATGAISAGCPHYAITGGDEDVAKAYSQFSSFYDNFVKWSNPVTGLLDRINSINESTSVTVSGYHGSIVESPGKEPQQIQDFIPDLEPVFLEELKAATLRVTKDGFNTVSDKASYETLREEILGRMKEEYNSDFYPGWYDPKGSNIELAPNLSMSYDDDELFDRIARAISVSTGMPAKASSLKPFDLQYPRKLSNNSDAGHIADRISSVDWNALMAMKDVPKFASCLMVLARVITMFTKSWKNPTSAGKVIKQLSDQYLNYNFGIAPTLSDIQDAVLTLEALTVPDAFTPRVATKLHFEGPRTAIDRDAKPRTLTRKSEWENFTYEARPIAGYQVLLDVQSQGEVDLETYLTFALVPRTIVRLKGYYPLPEFKAKMSPSDREAFIRTRAALNSSEFLPALGQTLWDMLPWSFILDYFADVSSYILNYGAADRNANIGIAELSDYRFQGLELIGTITHCASQFDYDTRSPKFLEEVEGPTFCLARYGLREFRRFRGLSDLPSGGLKLNTPNSRQWLNIAALVGSRKFS